MPCGLSKRRLRFSSYPNMTFGGETYFRLGPACKSDTDVQQLCTNSISTSPRQRTRRRCARATSRPQEAHATFAEKFCLTILSAKRTFRASQPGVQTSAQLLLETWFRSRLYNLLLP